MKHLFLTVCALLSIGYAFAEKHNVYIYSDPEIESIVDQNNKSYSFNEYGFYYGQIEDGTTLIFTMVEGSEKTMLCSDEDDNDVESGLIITIDASMPQNLFFGASDPKVTLRVNIPGICDPDNSLGIVLTLDGMLQDLQSYCVDGSLVIPDLDKGIVFTITSQVPVDWDGEGGNEPSTSFPPTTLDADFTLGNEVWDANNYRWDIWEKAGARNITYSNRTIRANMWNTVCFPFDIDETQMRANFGVAVEFISATFSESAGLEIECAYVTSMKANTPYLVMPSQTKSVFNFTNVDVKVNDASGQFEPAIVGTADDPVNFVGVMKPVTLYADDHSVLFVTAGSKVTYPNVTGDIKEFRGYFHVTPSSPASGRRARACIVIRDRKEEPTALNDNVMQNNNTKKYMQDGRLVIEINGVRYNAQGQAID